MMICQNCQQDVHLARNPQTGELICPECGRSQQERSSDQSTIAQTAHALLKRWEESRAQQTSSGQNKSTAAEASGKPLAQPQSDQSEKRDSLPIELPSRANVAEGPKLSDSEWDSLTGSPQQTGFAAATPRKTAAASNQNTSALPVTARQETPTIQQAVAESDASYNQSLLDALSSRDDANQFVRPQFSRREVAELVSEPNDVSLMPPRIPQDNRTLANTASRGQVRFKQESVSDMLNDLEVQQAIEKNQRQPRNWSAILGQLLVFGGAVAMTGGGAIVIGNYYGSLEIAITNGWLAVAGGHLLFVLGIYTHLSSRIDQTWKELHERADEMQKLLLQQNQMQQVLINQIGQPVGNVETKPVASSERFRSTTSEYAAIGS